MEKTIVPISTKIASQRHLSALRDGMVALIGVSVIGGLSMLLAMPPVPDGLTASNPFFAFLLAWQAWATANTAVLLTPYFCTIGIMSLYVVAGVSYKLANSYKMESLGNAINAIIVFLIISGAIDLSTSTISIGKLGASYMFPAIIVGLITVEITHQCQKHNLTIKMPDAVPPFVAAPFNTLIPLIINVVLFSVLNLICTNATGAGLTDLVKTIIQPLLSGTDSLPSLLLIQTIATIFWFFGVHGSSIVGVVVSPITTNALAANMAAYQAGQPLPYIWGPSLTGYFGNWPTYLAIILICMFVCKSDRIRAIGKVSLPTAIFNVNEPIIFGLPMVMNVYVLIPLILCSVINLSAYYLLAEANLIGRIYLSMPSTLPAPLMAFLASMDWKVMVLWFVIFAVDIIVCLPFMKLLDKQDLKEEEARQAELEAEK